MPGPLELFKGSLQFANGKVLVIVKTADVLNRILHKPTTNTLIYIFMESQRRGGNCARACPLIRTFGSWNCLTQSRMP